MRDVIYIGNSWTAAEYIFFEKAFNLVGIICEHDRVIDEIVTFSLVRGIPLYRVTRENPIEGYINNFDETYIYIMSSYGSRVPMERINNKKVFNIHPSALPEYKGRHPTFWAILRDETFMGISLHVVTEKFDEGNIIAQKLVPFFIWETEAQLVDKLMAQIPFLLETLVKYLSGEISALCLNDSGHYYRIFTDEDRMIDIEKDSPNIIYNKIRTHKRISGTPVQVAGKCFCLFDAKFCEKSISSAYVLEENLYIRYRDDICIVSSKFEEKK